MLIGPKVLLYPKVPIHSNVHLSQPAHALNGHLSHIPICPKYPFALVFIFPGGHFPPSAHFPKCPLAPKLIGPKVSICPQMPISLNAHLSQSSHAHLSQTSICPKCSLAPIVQCPFALVLIFPGGHFQGWEKSIVIDIDMFYFFFIECIGAFTFLNEYRIWPCLYLFSA